MQGDLKGGNNRLKDSLNPVGIGLETSGYRPNTCTPCETCTTQKLYLLTKAFVLYHFKVLYLEKAALRNDCYFV